jgi:Family of unknown function (DUF6714)
VEISLVMGDEAKQMAEGIIGEIRRAFCDVSRDEGVTLHEALVIDTYGSDSDRSAARELDTDRRWEDVPDQLIEENDSVLCFVDPKGFRYYLPAYMVWSLRNYETSEGFSHNHPIFSLSLSQSGSMRQWDLERFEVFNDEQARAICKFLRFMAQQDQDIVCVDKALEALDAYWGKFCDALAEPKSAVDRASTQPTHETPEL